MEDTLRDRIGGAQKDITLGLQSAELDKLKTIFQSQEDYVNRLDRVRGTLAEAEAFDATPGTTLDELYPNQFNEVDPVYIDEGDDDYCSTYPDDWCCENGEYVCVGGGS